MEHTRDVITERTTDSGGEIIRITFAAHDPVAAWIVNLVANCLDLNKRDREGSNARAVLKQKAFVPTGTVADSYENMGG